jgi:hypothetical protein
MQGVFIDGRRPKSKKEIREVVALDPARVRLERTQLVGDSEYDGLVSHMPVGKFMFVGPDPYTQRKFYGSIVRRAADDKLVVS